MLHPIFSYAAAILFAFSLVGCQSTPWLNRPAKEQSQGIQSGTMTAGIDHDNQSGAAPWEIPGSPIHKRVIYFSYDRSDIPTDYVPLLRSHAQFLAAHSSVKVTIEGHTDERGTRAYNLALGDRRANAVLQFLFAEGVSDDQLDTLSYGEEKPATPGHTESSWAMNRRAVLNYRMGG